MASFDQFIATLRQEFGNKNAGKKFEVFCKWFLENDPEWSKTVDKVWLWDDYPNKWQRQDLGTDLVFLDKNNLIWAVQAKCYSEHRTTTKNDMNSFLADTGRSGIDRRLWLQTTNKMEAKAYKTIFRQEKPVIIYNLNEFRSAQLVYPSSFNKLYQAKVKEKPTPEPHQRIAIKNMVTGLESKDRGQMIMPCGTGKTFTSLWIKEALEAHSTLVLLPSLSLLSQTMREWAWAANSNFEILNVCSDTSVGKRNDDMLINQAPFAVTSDVNEIVKFLEKPHPKVVFCTYQSSKLISDAQSKTQLSNFDLTIADEAHRCAGSAESDFATILDPIKIRSHKRLFTTATPKYFSKKIKSKANSIDLSINGMDDEQIFGPVLHKLSFGQAIQNGLLTDYQVVIIGVDHPMVKQWIDNNEIVSINPNKTTDARTLAAKIGLIKAIKDYNLKRIISFHSRVNNAREFSEEIKDIINILDLSKRPDGSFLSDYVSGEMNAGTRKEKIDRLKELEGHDRGILTNARCLAEGVDVPSLDGVAFIDPKGSPIEIIQSVGRAIRKVRGAKFQIKGTIIIPVFLEDGEDVETTIESSNFKTIWEILKALRAHDEIISDELDSYRTSLAKNVSHNNKEISDKIIFDMPSNIDAKFMNALRTLVVESSTANWEFSFGLLEKFLNTKGHCNVPQRYQLDGHNLGSWVGTQRLTKDKMSSKRIAKLDTLGFAWAPRKTQWEKGFASLKEFYKREGHSIVPDKFTEDGYGLGRWVYKQRKKKSSLSVEQVSKLNSLDFNWDPLEAKWEEGFSYLEKFINNNGHSMVPDNFIQNGYTLGNWVALQRANKDIISSERLHILNSVNFVWDVLEAQWEQGLIHLKIFFEREGHFQVAHAYKENGYNLGQWVLRQRQHKEKMPSHRYNRLEELGFVWDPLKKQWDNAFEILKKFYLREGNCIIPPKHKEEGFGLDAWAYNQRRKKGSLSSDQISQLNEIDFIWEKEQNWEKGFNYLKKFYNREGHCKVPNSHQENGFKLGSWVYRIRKKNNNPSELIDRLNTIEFNWDINLDQFEIAYPYLEQFYIRNGHTKVPSKHLEQDYNLGTWVQNLRKRKESLSKDQHKKLNALEFVWDELKQRWEDNFNLLKQFYEREGHSKVPSSHLESGVKLGIWVSNTKKRRDKLSSDRINRLKAINFF